MHALRSLLRFIKWAFSCIEPLQLFLHCAVCPPVKPCAERLPTLTGSTSADIHPGMLPERSSFVTLDVGMLRV
jgi:hypothetical protein